MSEEASELVDAAPVAGDVLEEGGVADALRQREHELVRLLEVGRVLAELARVLDQVLRAIKPNELGPDFYARPPANGPRSPE